MFEIQDNYGNLIRVELFDEHATAAVKFIKVGIFQNVILLNEIIYLLLIILLY